MKKNCASNWLFTKIITRCTVNKTKFWRATIDYFPLVLRLVFRRIRIAATAPITRTFVMSVCLSTGISAAPTNFHKIHIRDFNFIVARDINRP